MIEGRPQVSCSILIPLTALPWLRQIFDDASQLQSVPNPERSSSSVRTVRNQLRVLLLSIQRDRFIKVIEKLHDGRSASICIPEGSRSSEWSFFEHHLVRHFGNLVFLALSNLQQGSSPRYASPLQPHSVQNEKPFIITSHPFYPFITPPPLSNSEPQYNPADSVMFFTNIKSHQTSKVKPDDYQWKLAVNCDWLNNVVKNLRVMAPFIRISSLLVNGELYFFCKSSLQLQKVGCWFFSDSAHICNSE